jgi:hypothetical protein
MKPKALLLCDIRDNSPNTVLDYIESFKSYSEIEFYSYNPVGEEFPRWMDLSVFDIIVIHYTIYILGQSYLTEKWKRKIREFSSLKAIFIQDEYRTVNEICKEMKYLGINILFSCWPRESIDKVYHPGILPEVKKITVLTGYVPEIFERNEPDFKQDRQIDVGYRARGYGFYWLGVLYQEKKWIGVKFKNYIKKNNIDISFDISTKEEDRIYGNSWIQFLRRCNCVLGTESGASVVDFTGNIEKKCINYLKKYPDADFYEVRDKYFANEEGKFYMNQISPRIFEAIGCGCCLILFEGKYSEILKPWVHYLPLKKDFSNIEDIVIAIKDKKWIKLIAKQAYNDIIKTGKYSYEQFVAFVDKILLEYLNNVKNLRRNTGNSVQFRLNSSLMSLIYKLKKCKYHTSNKLSHKNNREVFDLMHSKIKQ